MITLLLYGNMVKSIKMNKRRRFYTIYERMRLESQRLDQQIKSLKNQLKAYPEGKLVCTQNKNEHEK